MFRATVSDVPPIAAALARAFDDDPVMEWVFPDRRTREARLVRLFSLMLRTHHLAHGETWTTDDHAGAAVWCSPDQWRIPLGRQFRNLPALVRLIGPSLFTRLRGLTEAERAHPTEPHWYLAVLGVDPTRQGHGLGSQLLGPVIERCDSEGVGAYLESSKKANLPFYERHGFTVTQDIALGEGPRIWAMWRDPR